MKTAFPQKPIGVFGILRVRSHTEASAKLNEVQQNREITCLLISRGWSPANGISRWVETLILENGCRKDNLHLRTAVIVSRCQEKQGEDFGWSRKQPDHILSGRRAKLFREISRIINREEPNLAIATDLKSFVLLRLALIHRRSKAKHVFWLHDRNAVRGLVRRWLFRLTAFGTPLVFVSKWLQDLYVWSWHQSATFVVYNGVPTPDDIDHNERLERPTSSSVLLYTARFVKAKNHSRLIALVNALESLGWEGQLWFVGDGPLKDACEEQVAELGLTARIAFIEPTPTWHKLLKMTTLYLHPGEEAFGLSVAEAMARNVPVAVAPIGGVLEFVCDGETGYLIDFDLPDQAADRISKILSDESRADLFSVGKAGRQYIVSNLSSDVFYRRFREVVFDIAGRSISGTPNVRPE